MRMMGKHQKEVDMSRLVDKVDDRLLTGRRDEEDGNEGGGIPGPEPNEEIIELYEQLGQDYKVYTYTDEQTGLSVSYHLYTPGAAEEGKQYPMIVFIGDASTVGPDLEKPVRECRGAMVWASAEEQKKHPCFVLVPQYPGVILDDHEDFIITPYIELTGRLIRSVAASHAVDRSRIYGTGQSMGCMTSLILHAEYSNLFAACMFVDGQWASAELEGLKARKFLYFAAEGDLKAHDGMSELVQIWKENKVPVNEILLDAKEPLDKQDADLSHALSEGNMINCITWKLGSVLPDGIPVGTIEHMYAFDFAYRLESAREWLLAQHT